MKFTLATIVLGLLSCSHSCAGFATNNNRNRLRSSSSSSSSSTLCNSPEGNNGIERREALNNLFRNMPLAIAAAAAITSSSPAQALDMDAFESSLLNEASKELIPTLNDDEALCKYGAPGKAMGEACTRAKIDRKLPGGVDVSGKVDRGDYLKCKFEYPIIDDKYVKTRVCKPSSEWPAD
mmetsp:Transcript_32057/g.67387  ORF Transcript_32057/g.67387 Transcript_32057/m.67387 type:complete len:180 (-) Transcript_32057:104-643(-)|eukprot:CAMPEP_0172305060 /NCGR_PEP_ID=MMETSP1058-20130122/6393_1 /TAXON_ID=83371 /ORGANISM="Detonula confervacea, Strain CCMP 353" /LENGTH=179 /DNA_ID=CAMNT_0013016523 /DNA_START=140 /DNA_END=679 /DNA_ORIENTATION=+